MNKLFLPTKKHLSAAIVGPAGTGKATLCLMLITIFPNLFEVVGSYTTRDLKEEIHGKKYTKVTREEFIRLKDEGKIMESNDYTGTHLYGTSRESYDAIIEAGKIPLFDIDINGVLQIRNILGADEFLVFFLECEIEEIERRLRGRNTENNEQIIKRIETGKKENESAKALAAVNVINELVPYGVGMTAEPTARGMYRTIEIWKQRVDSANAAA